MAQIPLQTLMSKLGANFHDSVTTLKFVKALKSRNITPVCKVGAQSFDIFYKDTDILPLEAIQVKLIKDYKRGDLYGATQLAKNLGIPGFKKELLTELNGRNYNLKSVDIFLPLIILPGNSEITFYKTSDITPIFGTLQIWAQMKNRVVSNNTHANIIQTYITNVQIPKIDNLINQGFNQTQIDWIKSLLQGEENYVDYKNRG